MSDNEKKDGVYSESEDEEGESESEEGELDEVFEFLKKVNKKNGSNEEDEDSGIESEVEDDTDIFDVSDILQLNEEDEEYVNKKEKNAATEHPERYPTHHKILRIEPPLLRHEKFVGISGHSCTTFKSQFVYYYDGWNGLSCYNSLTKNFRLIPSVKKISQKDEKKISQISAKSLYTSEASVDDVIIQTLQIPKRRNHSSVIYNEELYLFGGHEERKISCISSIGDVNLNDIIRHDLKQTIDIEDIKGDPPKVRRNHSSIVRHNEMIVIGGVIMYLSSIFEMNLHVYNFISKTWKIQKCLGKVIPCPRFAHGCVYDSHTDLMYVFFGINMKNHSCNDAFVYNFKTNMWTNISNDFLGDVPLSKGFMGISIYDENIFIFGGKHIIYNKELYSNDLYMYNTLNSYWTKISIPNGFIRKRSNLCLNSIRRYKVIIFGGYDGLGDERLKDLYEIWFEPCIENLNQMIQKKVYIDIKIKTHEY